jgi:glycosyltransferase involved in cell wall biosynthesis
MNQTSCNESVSTCGKYISVVLPVYNGAAYLHEAIDSIIRQTYSDFELIIIDDGSKDDSAVIVNTYNDPRIRFYSQKNLGLAATLNRGISLAGGKYIARQDQDDISLPRRLAKQLEFLETNKDYGMVGTWAEIWEDEKPTDRSHKHPVDNLELKFFLLFDNPFVHSSMMIRKSVFDVVGGYSTDRERQPPEDYELWSRVSKKFKVANIPEMLHVYREMPQSMSRTGDNPFLNHLLRINVENLAFATSGKYPELAYRDLAALSHAAYMQYSKKTALKDMIAIIQDSAQALLAGEDDGCKNIHDSFQSAVTRLRYHYYQARYSGTLGNSGRMLFQRAVRVCRRLLYYDRGNS